MEIINKINLKQLAILLFYIMFIYSGINKIKTFSTKVETLGKKTELPNIINQLGMIGVILLEIVGSILIIYDNYNKNVIPKLLIDFTKIQFLLFLIVVTFLYHPPTDKIIPFLSNLTTFGGLLYMYSDGMTV